jgi:hypothetical protein
MHCRLPARLYCNVEHFIRQNVYDVLSVVKVRIYTMICRLFLIRCTVGSQLLEENPNNGLGCQPQINRFWLAFAIFDPKTGLLQPL